MAKEKATSTALATITSVPDALGALTSRISALKHIQDSVYCTPGKITMANGKVLDIKEEKDVSELVSAFSGVRARIHAKEQAYTALGIDNHPVVKIDGGTEEEWTKDIQLRIAIINQKEELDHLNTLKKEFEDLMDKEDKMKLLLDKMSKL